MKDSLISIYDLSKPEIEEIFTLAAKVKKNPASYRDALKGKMFALIFEKPSTRTRVSFEAGIFSMSGGCLYLGPGNPRLGVREEIRDVARVMSRYLSGVVLRTFSHATILQFQKYFQKPVINGLSDFEHPCQALADYFTLREHLPKNTKPTLAFIGDGNNVLNSLIFLAAKLGCRLNYATPLKHEPSKDILENAKKLARQSGAVLEGFSDPAEAVRDADAVYTDVWISMGEEKIRSKKLKSFKGIQVNEALMKKAKKGALVMHCLPAHRGEEITDEVMEGRNSIIFDQAENRLHIQKAVLLKLCS